MHFRSAPDPVSRRWALPAASGLLAAPVHLALTARRLVARQLVAVDDADAPEWNFYNTLKQALFLRYGTTKPMMTLSKTDQTQLWEGLVSGAFRGARGSDMLMRGGVGWRPWRRREL